MTDFEKKVLQAVCLIPKGRICTYAAIARAVGAAKSARAVGNALNKNPHLQKIPCHRVVKSSGLVGGYVGGSKQKINLLRKEGIKISAGKIINFAGYL